MMKQYLGLKPSESGEGRTFLKHCGKPESRQKADRRYLNAVNNAALANENAIATITATIDEYIGEYLSS